MRCAIASGLGCLRSMAQVRAMLAKSARGVALEAWITRGIDSLDALVLAVGSGWWRGGFVEARRALRVVWRLITVL